MFEKGRIPLIHNYCDRWCERCAFTDRCGIRLTELAIAMCGDERAGFELALGEPQPVGEVPPQPDYLSFLDAAERGEREDEDDVSAVALALKRADESPHSLDIQGREYMFRAIDWTRTHADAWHEKGDAVLRDALEVVSWDASLIGAKVHRALFSRALRIEAWDDEDPVQNDANGSAKVALISLQRSEAGWAVVASATGDAEAASLGVLAGALREDLNKEFSDAIAFVRPGFDEPPGHGG
jgi:hypothetical protein